MMVKNDKFYMQEALQEAHKALKKQEVPIGAVVVCEDAIVGRGYNQRETLQRSTAHAEVIAIDEACRTLGSWRLEDCTIYVTVEPCPMCAGTIIQSRIKRLVYAAADNKNGAHVSGINVFNGPFNHTVDIDSGVMAEESKELIQAFFSSLRK